MTTQAADTVVRTSIVVGAPVEHAFSVFTDGIDSWWERSHTIGEQPLPEAFHTIAEFAVLASPVDPFDPMDKAFKVLDGEFKTQQRRLIERMEAEGTDSLKADGTSFSPVKLEYGTIQDRQQFVAWALENDPELVEYK